jgi:diguanylate cyclase (GGDEF)-like protein/PAS domain S-box-containing protein
LLALQQQPSPESEPLHSEVSSVAIRQRRRARWEAVLLSALMLVVVGAAILGLWLSSRESAYQGFSEYLTELAQEAATTIDPVLLARIRRPEQLNDADYARAVAPLRRLRQAVPKIHYAYTFARVGDTIHFVLDAADPHALTRSGQPEQSGVWEVYPHRNESMLQALGDAHTRGVATANMELNSDEWGIFMSGFAPIRDTHGRDIGAVGLDVDASMFASRLAGFRNHALLGLAPAGVFIAVVGVLFYRVRCRGLTDAEAVLASASAAIRASEILDTERRRLREVIEGTNVGTWEWNSNTRLVTISDRADVLLGYAPGELAEFNLARLRTLVHAEDYGPLKRVIGESLRSPGSFFSHEFRIRHAFGQWTWILARGKVLQARGERRPQLIAGIVMDVSALKEMESALIKAAQEDRLTGLPNRTVFMQHLEAALARVRSGQQAGCAVLFFDFDRFKVINDTLGHEAGDELLRQIARRLKAALRVGDLCPDESGANLISRFGGDEFLILINDLRAPGDAVRVAERLLNALAPAYSIFEHEVHSMASVGIVTGEQCGGSAEEAIRNADVAMYEAKRAGRGCSVVFSEAMHERMARHLAIETSLRRAIGSNELYLAYEPVVELQSGRRRYVEASLRWNHPTLGAIAPHEFLPIAEDSGLMGALGPWMLDEACRALADWRRQDLDGAPAKVSLSISSSELARVDRFIEQVRGTLRATTLPAHCLQIEVSEQDVMRSADSVQRLLTELQRQGVKLALRDFGAGHCSLSVLREFPFDTIKIDRAFTRDLQAGHAGLAVIGATLTLIRNLGRLSVADGVENAAQVAVLQVLGCDCGQGPLFGEAVAGEGVLTVSQARQSAVTGYR